MEADEPSVDLALGSCVDLDAVTPGEVETVWREGGAVGVGDCELEVVVAADVKAALFVLVRHAFFAWPGGVPPCPGGVLEEPSSSSSSSESQSSSSRAERELRSRTESKGKVIALDGVGFARAANAIGRVDMTSMGVETPGEKLNVGMLGVRCAGLDYD